MSIQDYLMTQKEYNKTRHSIPYFYILSKSGQYLYYFGAHHSRKVDDPQNKLIKDFWDGFTKKTLGKKRVALEEGGIRPGLETEEDAIRRWGEAGLLSFLAAKDSVSVQTPEPDEQKKFEYLSVKYRKDYVLYFFWNQLVGQYLRHNLKDFEEYLNSWKDEFSQQLGQPYNIEIYKKIHQEIFGKKFDLKERDFLIDLQDPYKRSPDPIFGKLNLEEAVYRDKYILEQIEKLWTQGNSLFIVYGCSHAVMQEPALRKMVEES